MVEAGSESMRCTETDSAIGLASTPLHNTQSTSELDDPLVHDVEVHIDDSMLYFSSAHRGS